MTRLYDDAHRAMQDAFETRKLADIVEKAVVRPQIEPDDKAFIESRDMLFLSSVDQQGRPTVSYKGGDPGFVTVIDPATLSFPSYDGNGMYLSLGNISSQAQIGLLFIDFEQPHRLRVQGRASLHRVDPLLAAHPGAEAMVRVDVEAVFKNCGRYIHRYQKAEASRFVPRQGEATPMPDWKRLEILQHALPPKDQGAAEQHGGTLTQEQLAALERRQD